MTFRGHVSNGVVLLENAAGLPNGTLVEVTLLGERGANAAALIAAMEGLPRIPREWVDELEQAIAAGRRPPSAPAVFPDEPASPEND